MADRDLHELLQGNDKVLLSEDGDIWEGMRWTPKPPSVAGTAAALAAGARVTTAEFAHAVGHYARMIAARKARR